MSQDDFKKYSRFFAEEVSRRNIKRDAQPLTRSQILAILFPGFEKVVLKYKTDLKAHLDKRMNEDNEDPYETYR